MVPGGEAGKVGTTGISNPPEEGWLGDFNVLPPGGVGNRGNAEPPAGLPGSLQPGRGWGAGRPEG